MFMTFCNDQVQFYCSFDFHAAICYDMLGCLEKTTTANSNMVKSLISAVSLLTILALLGLCLILKELELADVGKVMTLLTAMRAATLLLY